MREKKRLVIVDYGIGNLHSVKNAFDFLDTPRVDVEISQDENAVKNADAVVFPGQGAVKSCMDALNQKPALRSAVVKACEEKPFLGICMGMQMLFSYSEENGGETCLEMIPGEVCAFQPGGGLKVPHMGWNTVAQKEHPLWHGIENHSYFYFVHSYYCLSHSPQGVVGETEYGVPFVSAVALGEKGFAIQAHPEKSGSVGLKFLENFLHSIQCVKD